ncbi:MAG: hypothetical protein H6998_19100 [Hahellaceae bacterium]|nr:hypothetical protein [Hahellaceae bacterium]
MIAHHEPSNTTLYHRIYMEDIQQNSVLLSVKNAKEATFVKDELTGYHVTVGIDPEAMDELAIAWCKHRKLQGALGGPVGKEWGSPDCDYD